MDEPALVVVKSQHDGTEICAASLRLGISANHALELVPDLDLEPVAAAMFLVGAASFLSHDALQSVLACHLEQCTPLLLIMIGVAQRVAAHQDRGQGPLAIFKVYLSQVVPIQIEEVKGVIQYGHIGVWSHAPPARPETLTLLHQAEGGAALLVQRDCFPIENHA